jgi:hypothetical protein
MLEIEYLLIHGTPIFNNTLTTFSCLLTKQIKIQSNFRWIFHEDFAGNSFTNVFCQEEIFYVKYEKNKLKIVG